VRNSLFGQIISSNLTVLVLSFLILVAFSLKTTRENSIETEAIALKRMAMLIRKVLITNNILEKENLNKRVQDYSELIGARITIVDKTGLVIAESKHDYQVMENHKGRPEIRRAFAGDVSQSLRYSNTLKLEMLYVAVAIPDFSEPTHVLRLALPLRQLLELQEDLRFNLILSSLIVLFISLLISSLLVRRLVAPIRDLTNASSQFAKGDFEVMLPEDGRSSSELGQLKDSFLMMAVRIKNLINNLTKQKFELQNTVNSLSDPLIVYDYSGSIIRWNSAFENKLSTEKIHPGAKLSELLPIDLEKILKSFFTESYNTQEFEFQVKGRYYSHGKPEKLESGEASVVIYDISEERLLEKMKRDFTVNVSHEIRTPLTAIYGFLESMKDHVSDEGRSYLTIIEKNTYRMLRLVEDLKELSTLEGNSLSIEKNSFPLNRVVLETLESMKSAFTEKGLTYKTIFIGNNFTYLGDSHRIQQVMYNLLENSLRYTDSGGVIICLKRFKNHLLLLVKDSGIGIPEKYQERIFERFYVVDKSRSRSMGGTGLGLSIVKHILMAHDATIKIKSRVNQGTKIFIFFPI
jgi:two-component system, OmpR family, phosphate regulon sensor histidine kinase PhoR